MQNGHEEEANLGDTTTAARPAQNLGDLDQLDRLLCGIHLRRLENRALEDEGCARGEERTYF